MLDLWLSVLCMRSKAWLAARVSLRLARLLHTTRSAQRSRRLRSTRAAAPVLLAHAEVTKNIKYFWMGPKLRHTAVSPASEMFCNIYFIIAFCIMSIQRVLELICFFCDTLSLYFRLSCWYTLKSGRYVTMSQFSWCHCSENTISIALR